MKRAFIAAALAVCWAGPSVASDWSGGYIGVDAGYRFNGGYIDEYNDRYFTTGAVGGVYAGYMFQSGNAVFGIEGDLSLSTSDFDVSDFQEEYNSRIDTLVTIRGRAGFLAGDTLIFASAGVAFAEQYFFHPDGGSVTAWHSGWVAGAGVETSVSERYLVRLEYLHIDPSSKDYDVGYGDYEAGIDPIDQVRVGVALRF